MVMDISQAVVDAFGEEKRFITFPLSFCSNICNISPFNCFYDILEKVLAWLGNFDLDW